MGKVIVMNAITLDGVMQSPGRPDEDTRGEFADGGWAIPVWRRTLVAKMGERMGADQAFLLGRRSYEDMLSFLEQTGRSVQGRAQRHTEVRRLAQSRDEARMAQLDTSARRRRRRRGRAQTIVDGNLVVMGSGELITALMSADLIDEYLLMIAPLVLGTGRRLFPDGVRASLRLTDSTSTSKGVMITIYEPVNDPGSP